MSADESTSRTLEGQVRTFLERNFPQIRLHGGDATITECDAETGVAGILLAGACSGCGVSPMTIQAIKKRLPAEIPAIDEVRVETSPVDRDEDAGDAADSNAGADGHHGMGGHPAGGGITLDYEGEIPDWRKDD